MRSEEGTEGEAETEDDDENRLRRTMRKGRKPRAVSTGQQLSSAARSSGGGTSGAARVTCTQHAGAEGVRATQAPGTARRDARAMSSVRAAAGLAGRLHAASCACEPADREMQV
jgi:hypothetical protein